MTNENTKEATNFVLRQCCKFLKADRSYFLNINSTNNVIKAAYEYCDFETISLLDIPEQEMYANEDWVKKLLNKEIIFEPNIRTKEALIRLGKWAKFIEQVGSESIYGYGVYIYNKLIGYFGISYELKKHTLSEIEKNFMTTISHLLEIAINKNNNEEKVLDALQQAFEASNAKSYFLASLSHEIRTPLNAYSGFPNIFAKKI